MPHLLIGISGKARSGKDTVASIIEEMMPGIHRTNFSHAITEEYDGANGTLTRHDEQEKLRHRPGIAELAEKRREEDAHYWSKKTLSHEGDTLVAGVRAVSEAEFVKEKGGVLIRVEVSPKRLEERMGEHFHHLQAPNERHLDKYDGWDYIITNDGTLEDLESKVADVVGAITLTRPL